MHFLTQTPLPIVLMSCSEKYVSECPLNKIGVFPRSWKNISTSRKNSPIHPLHGPLKMKFSFCPQLARTFYHYRTLSSLEGRHLLSSGKELVEYLKQQLYESEGQTICSIAVRHCQLLTIYPAVQVRSGNIVQTIFVKVQVRLYCSKLQLDIICVRS